MNKLLALSLLLFLTTSGVAQDQGNEEDNQNNSGTATEPAPELRKIAARDASQFIGETLVVCGTVASGTYNARSQSKTTYLNFDKPYPYNTFTAVILRKNRRNFDYQPEKLEGQYICVYGPITEYRGQPEINVVISKQIIATEYPR